MPNIARDVHSAQPLQMPVVVRSASDAILAFMATLKTPAFAPNANPVFKTSRAKPRVLPAPPARRPTTNQRRVKTHRGAPATLAKNICMTWDLETNGLAKRALQGQCATQIPAGPPCKSGKATGSSLGTQNKPHPLPNARFPLATLQTMGPIVPPVPSVSSVAFVTPISIAPQQALATLVRPLPPRHERGPWSL
jgi:hypothetical protein